MTITILILVVITIIGLAYYLYNLAALVKRMNYVEEFIQKFIELVNSITTGGRDFSLERNDDYVWLLDNQYKIQVELGADGTVFYRDPLRGIVDRNHQIIPNFLLEIPPFVREIRQSIYVNSISSENFLRQAEMCVNILTIHKGRLNEAHQQLWKHRFNPLFFFSEGVKAILSTPLVILKSFGLLNETSYEKLVTSKVFGCFSAIAALIGFVSSIIGIILGWSEFLAWVKNLLGF